MITRPFAGLLSAFALALVPFRALAPQQIAVGPNVHVSRDAPMAVHGEYWAHGDPTNPNRLVVCSVAGDSSGFYGQYYYISHDRGASWKRTLEQYGFGPQLLCSVFGFTEGGGSGRRFHLVYLYKRGTFYPFAPLGGERRDNELELRVKATLAGDLPIEPELSRWFALWGLPLD